MTQLDLRRISQQLELIELVNDFHLTNGADATVTYVTNELGAPLGDALVVNFSDPLGPCGTWVGTVLEFRRLLGKLEAAGYKPGGYTV